MRHGIRWGVGKAMAMAALLTLSVGTIVQPLATQNSLSERAGLLGGDGSFQGPRNASAFSRPLSNLTFADRAEFNIGNAVFERPWATPPASTTSSDGLGPLFNARSCDACHIRDGRGHPPAGNYPSDTSLSMLMRLSVPPRTEAERKAVSDGEILFIPDPTYGGQLQDNAVAALPIEGRPHIEYEETVVELAGGEIVGLRRPIPSIAELGYGPHADDLLMSLRIAPPMIGLGLLEVIPEASILALADPDDDDGNGISGRPHWLGVTGATQLGRFGWKATQPTLHDQNMDAFKGDIGMSSDVFPMPWGDCTEAQTACRNAPHGISDAEAFEVQPRLADALLFYTRTIAVPARPDHADATVVAGGVLFEDIGCAACHIPSHVTREDAAIPALSEQLIWPFTDLLLHDMGEGLADDRPVGRASGREWRTPPLWGIGLTRTVSGHTNFLHDGRARNLVEAILWHGGEAEASRNAFRSLPPNDRTALITFLESL